jgi:nucleotide-binding universal stress UspA family protein
MHAVPEEKAMFKKILIPTDGSPLSAQAANAGVNFARSVNAEIVALHVSQPFAATIGFDGMAAAYAITDDAYEKAVAEQSARYLEAITSRAHDAGVVCTPMSVSNFNVAEGIVHTAHEAGCDLVFIGSHGRSGLSRLLLGSVTAKVLSLAQQAVLVYRVKDEKKEEKKKEKAEA